MIAQTELKKNFSYNPYTGEISRKDGKEYSSTPNCAGYIRHYVCNKSMYAHRIAWLYTYGELPKSIDHINGDRADNRIANLRAADQSVNMKNSSRWSHNTSGVTGVGWHKQNKRWRAYIKVDGVDISLGTYICFTAAVLARKIAEVKYNFHPNHDRQPIEE